MATISDIVNLDSRKGDVAAGGGDAGAVQLNSQPLQQLALYTNLYNKGLVEQQQKDKDTKIEQIAAVSKIDLNNLFAGDRDFMEGRVDKLKKIAAIYVRNPNITIKDYLLWQTELADVQHDYDSGKVRAADYYTQMNEIDQSGESSAIIAARKKQVENNFADTDIKTRLPKKTGYKPVAIDIPDPIKTTFENLQQSKDEEGIYTLDQTVFVPEDNSALATRTNLGLDALTKNLTGTDKEIQDLAAGKAQLWAGMTGIFNTVLKEKNADGSLKYFNADNSFNLSKFKSINDKTLVEPLVAIEKLKAYSKEKQGQIALGMFRDLNTGLISPNLESEKFDKGIIEITPDGLTADQLGLAGIYAKYDGDKVTKKYQKTGIGNDKFVANTGRMNAITNQGKLKVDEAKLDFDKDKWKATQTGGEELKNSAVEKAKRIYGELQALADSKGTITPNKVRQLNAEQLKYLGSEGLYTSNTTGLPSSTFTPLGGFKDKDGKEIQTAIQIKDGKITVLRPESGNTLETGKDGTLFGKFDPQSSTNFTNIVNNIYNEQVKNAAGKELGGYEGVNKATNDPVGGENTTTTQIKAGSSSYVETVTVKGVKWGKRADGTIEKIK